MKVGFVADTHIANFKRWGGPIVAGINRRCALALAAIQTAAELAVASECAALVICGDLFDHAKPEPQIVARVQEILAFVRRNGCRPIVLVGNHDQVSSAPGDHALGPLAPVAKIIDSPCCVEVDDVELVLVPFNPAPATENFAAWVDRALVSSFGRERRICAAHVGIIDATTPAFLRGARDAIPVEQIARICAERGIEAVSVGNWHTRKLWTTEPPVFQAGTLAPAGFDDPGMRGYGALAIWDSATGFSHVRIPGPRFIVARAPAELSAEVRRAQVGDTLFISFRGPADEHESVRDILVILEGDGIAVGGIEFVADDDGGEAQAEAADQARAAGESLAEALSAFVASMPVPQDVDRQAVLEEAARSLRAAGPT